MRASRSRACIRRCGARMHFQDATCGTICRRACSSCRGARACRDGATARSAAITLASVQRRTRRSCAHRRFARKTGIADLVVDHERTFDDPACDLAAEARQVGEQLDVRRAGGEEAFEVLGVAGLELAPDDGLGRGGHGGRNQEERAHRGVPCGGLGGWRARSLAAGRPDWPSPADSTLRGKPSESRVASLSHGNG